MTTLALCMAGTWRRFREAGYTTPKYLLPLQGRPILSHIVDELAPSRLLLVANKRDRDWESAIKEAAPTGALHFIDDTEGQAATALEAADLAMAHGWGATPFVLHNVDTILYDRSLRKIGDELQWSTGFIDVFEASNPAYSYVSFDDRRNVTAIAEKKVISRWATTGLYGFSSPETYVHHASTTNKRSGGEFYVSDVYQKMLERGASIRVDPTARRTVVLGTPEEYEAYVAENP